MSRAVAAFATAYGAIKNRMGAHHVKPSPMGLEVHRRGWPVLLITTEAAQRFAQEIEEASHD